MQASGPLARLSSQFGPRLPRKSFTDQEEVCVNGPEGAGEAIQGDIMNRVRVAVVILILALVSSTGCHQEPTRPRSVTLPPGSYDPVAVAVCPAGETLVFVSQRESPSADPLVYHRSVSILDLRTGKLREVFRGGVGGLVAAPTPHLFALTTLTKEGDRSHLVLLHDWGSLQGTVPHPNAAWFDPHWSQDGKFLAFPMDRPDVTEDSPEYNPLGFTAVGILEVATLQLRWFPVETPAYYMHFASFDDRIYVSHALNEGSEHQAPVGVTVYDVTGQRVASTHERWGTYFSPRGQYYLPHLHEGGLPFEIYEARTNHPVRTFPGVNSRTGEYFVYGPWNPTNDDLVMIRHSVREAERLEVYSISQGKVLRSFPTQSPVTWAPDGKAVIIFEDGKVVFEPVTP